MVRDNPERLLGTRPAHGVSSSMAHGSQNTDHGWKRNSLATTAHRRFWGQWRESDLQIAEWHGNTVHAFALAGSGRCGLRENRLDRDVEWRAGRFPIREIDLGIRTNCSTVTDHARDMSDARLSQVLSIRCGQQCRPCPPYPEPMRPPRARECEAQRSEMKLCRTGNIRVPQLSASTHSARSPRLDATEETHRE